MGDDDRAFKNMFSPEFRNRLDTRVRFKALDPSVMGSIVDKFIAELALQLADQNVSIELSPEARDHLAKKGYDPQMGARPLARVIDEDVKKPLTNELLFGKLEEGGHVLVSLEGDNLAFVFETESRVRKAAEILH